MFFKKVFVFQSFVGCFLIFFYKKGKFFYCGFCDGWVFFKVAFEWVFFKVFSFKNIYRDICSK